MNSPQPLQHNYRLGGFANSPGKTSENRYDQAFLKHPDTSARFSSTKYPCPSKALNILPRSTYNIHGLIPSIQQNGNNAFQKEMKPVTAGTDKNRNVSRENGPFGELLLRPVESKLKSPKPSITEPSVYPEDIQYYPYVAGLSSMLEGTSCLQENFSNDRKSVDTNLSRTDELLLKPGTPERPIVRPEDTSRRAQYRKTKPCPWYTRGKCWLNDQCNYAHNEAELQIRPDLTRTKLCAQGTKCTSSKCRFAHRLEELRATGVFFRTKLCKYWSRGVECPSGSYCRHAHGLEQLRANPEAVNKRTRSSVEIPDLQYDDKQDDFGYTSPNRSNILSQRAVDGLSLRNLNTEQASQISDSLVTELLQQMQWECGISDLNASLASQSRERDIFSELSSPSSCVSVFAYETPPNPHSKSSTISISPSPTQLEATVPPTFPPLTMDSPRASSSVPSTYDESRRNSVDDGTIQLNEILHLAVASRDPKLLESSARVLRASLKLKTHRKRLQEISDQKIWPQKDIPGEFPFFA